MTLNSTMLATLPEWARQMIETQDATIVNLRQQLGNAQQGLLQIGAPNPESRVRVGYDRNRPSVPVEETSNVEFNIGTSKMFDTIRVRLDNVEARKTGLVVTAERNTMITPLSAKQLIIRFADI